MYKIEKSEELLAILKNLCDGEHSQFNSIHQLEVATGIGRSNISKYDTISPTLKNLLKISKALDMKICFLSKDEVEKLS